MASLRSSKLFEPLRIGTVELAHRIVLAPLTRLRATSDQVPLPFVKDYYAQRASTPGSLLISEGIMISRFAGVIAYAPGIWFRPQISTWSEIVDAVHAKGSYMFAQIVGSGRAASFVERQKDGLDLFGPSAIPIGATLGGSGVVSADSGTPIPREMTEEEIWRVIEDFAQAAKNAVHVCGFDGVEVNACNGHLIDQFIQDVSNIRNDAWGGSVEKRSRFAIEVAKAVIAAIGKDKVGFRFSPYNTYLSMGMLDPVPQFTHLIRELKKLDIAYIHLVEPRIAGDTTIETGRKESSTPFLDAWGIERPAIVAGGYSPDSAMKMFDTAGDYHGRNVAVAFGRHYVSNPDLVFRMMNNVSLAPYDRSTFYVVGSEKGYTDYEFSGEFCAQVCRYMKINVDDRAVDSG